MKTSLEKTKKIKQNAKKKRIKEIILLILIIFIFSLGAIIQKRNTIVEYILENTIGDLVKADISLESIDINTKGIFFRDLKVHSTSDINYSFESPQLDINLNYSSLVNMHNWLNEVVDSLYIESPIISFNHKFGENEGKKKNDKPSKGFDVKHYLRKASITNANLATEIKYQEYFGIKDTISNAYITFDNSREESLIAKMRDNQMNPFHVELFFDKQGLNSLKLNVLNYQPDSLYVPVVRDLDFTLTGEAELKLGGQDKISLTMNVFSKEIRFSVYDMPGELRDLRAVGSLEKLQIYPGSSSFMGIPLELQGELLSLLDDGGMVSSAKVDKYQVGDILPFMKGQVDGRVEVNGIFTDLHISGWVDSDSLEVSNLPITDVEITFDYREEIELNVHNLVFDNNLISGKGLFKHNILTAELEIKNRETSDFMIQGFIDTDGIILDNNLNLMFGLEELTIGYKDYLLPPISGQVRLNNDLIQGQLSNDNLFINFDSNTTLTKSQANIFFLDYLLDNSFTSFGQGTFASINPLINGNFSVKKDKDDLESEIDLEITAFQDEIYLPVKTNLKWNLASNMMTISNSIFNGKIYNKEVSMVGDITLDEFQKLNADISINKDIIIIGQDLLDKKRKLKMQVNQISLAELKKFLPKELTKGYPNGYITSDIDYQWSSELIAGDVVLTGLEVAGFSGYGIHSSFEGNTERICLNEFKLYNERQILVNASGFLDIADGVQANVNAVVNEINFSDYQNIIPLKGFFNADLNLIYDSKDEEKYSLRIKGIGSDFTVADFDIDDVYFNALYTPKKIHVDNLYLNSLHYANLNIIGDFSYDIFKNEFIPSDEKLYVNLNADAYKVLKKISPDLFTDGNFNLRTELIIGIGEEGLQVYEGYLKSEDGYLKIVDQPETLEGLNIFAVIKDNMLDLSKFEFSLGDGLLNLTNSISDDNDNFFVGNLILGQFRLLTSNRGIIAHIPQYMPKDETALVEIGGRYNKYASIKGPFDDMKIDAEVSFSNASIIYPPNTENLTSIITSASKSTFKKNGKQAEKKTTSNNPLPFQLDVKLIVGENVKYVTYPTNIMVTPNSYLTLVYDKNMWSVPDARFVAEEGTVTFLDTEFNVELVQVLINELDLSINGTFIKRVKDGSVVTLRVSNEQSNQVGLQDLNLTLESDNPDDKTQTQVINRLRYTGESYNLNAEEESALQDETMLMLGSNVDKTYINSFLKPVETLFRRGLKLDYFHIRPGFIKNMVSNYFINEQADDVNVSQSKNVSDSELAQFSSSILLNNLTLNFGRPLYKRIYFNYEGFFQEAIDLNRNSKIIYDQDFQLRTNIDFKTKMSYTFKYRPSGKSSHEVMLFHSLNF